MKLIGGEVLNDAIVASFGIYQVSFLSGSRKRGVELEPIRTFNEIGNELESMISLP